MCYSAENSFCIFPFAPSLPAWAWTDFIICFNSMQNKPFSLYIGTCGHNKPNPKHGFCGNTHCQQLKIRVPCLKCQMLPYLANRATTLCFHSNIKHLLAVCPADKQCVREREHLEGAASTSPNTMQQVQCVWQCSRVGIVNRKQAPKAGLSEGYSTPMQTNGNKKALLCVREVGTLQTPREGPGTEW